MRITLVSIFLVLTLASTAQQYDLKLNLQKGQHYNQTMVMDLDMTQTIAGQEMSITTKMQFEFIQTVKSATKEGNFELESEYSHIIIDGDAAGQKMSYDSKVKDESGSEVMKTYTNAFNKIIGKKFVVVLSPKGKVIEIKGFKELMASLEKGKLDAATQKLIEGSFDEQKMASNFEASYHIFPDNPVKIGDTWSSQSSVESMVPINLTTNYTLKDVNNNVAKIAAAGTFTLKKDDYEVSGITMKIDFAGTYTGSYDMDINTGINNSSVIAMPMQGTMEVMGMEFPVTVNSTTHSAITPTN